MSTTWAPVANIKGPIGIKGDTGPPGPTLNMKGTLANTSLLPIPANIGDSYTITDPSPDEIWVYGSNGWVFSGNAGVPGNTGPQGPKGDTGATGPAGPGIATGGTTNQVLTKKTATDYDTQWTTALFGMNRIVSVISGSTTAAAAANTDYTYFCIAVLTLTLPTAIGNKNRYTVKNTSTGSITIGTTASQTIDGASTFVIDVQYMAVDLVSDGTNWGVV